MAGSRYAIAVMSMDRVGIISNVTGTIVDLGGNIDKMSQTVMDNCFTILLIVDFPNKIEAQAVSDAVAKGGRSLGLKVSVMPYKKPARVRDDGIDIFFMTVEGDDRKGLVFDVTDSLAAHGINISDLYCATAAKGKFLLIGEIEAPSSADIAQVQIDIESIGDGEPLSVRIQHEDFFYATNNLYMYRRELGA